MQEGLAKASADTSGVSSYLAVCLLVLPSTHASAWVVVTAQSAQPDIHYCYISPVNIHAFPF